MVNKIKIFTKNTGYIIAEIIPDRNPKTAKAIVEALPFNASINRWGDEIYFSIPVSLGEENVQQEVEIGDICYWPPGNGFCIFFGKTPASISDKPRAASPVNVFGRIIGDATLFKNTTDGEKIRIEKTK